MTGDQTFFIGLLGAVVLLLTSLINTFVTVMWGRRAEGKIIETGTKLDTIHIAINSRLDQAIDAAKLAGRSEVLAEQETIKQAVMMDRAAEQEKTKDASPSIVTEAPTPIVVHTDTVVVDTTKVVDPNAKS